VDLIQAYLNRGDLVDALVSAVQQLQRAEAQTGEPAFSLRSTQASSQWRVGNRLSEVDQARLIADFAVGTSKRKLAERYGISESSVKRLIRRRRGSKPPCGLSPCGCWPGGASGARRVDLRVPVAADAGAADRALDRDVALPVDVALGLQQVDFLVAQVGGDG
jgi:hypothetical protein